VHEFENLAYLDLQKTGTTTIVSALRALLAEKEVYKDIHGPIPRKFDRKKNCFVSVREPLAAYISLFNYGVGSKRGTLFGNMFKKGLIHYYDPTLEAFECWLEYVLDPENAPVVSRLYSKSFPAGIAGLMTYRLLHLCIPKAQRRLRSCSTRAALSGLFEQKRVYSEYVRTEHLFDDLFHVLRQWEGQLRLKSPLTTVEDMASSLRARNVSRKVAGVSPETVSPRLRQLVREREWLIYREFGYDEDPKGKPTLCIRDPEKAGARRRRRADRRARRSAAAADQD